MVTRDPTIVVLGARGIDDLPGIERIQDEAMTVFATTADELRQALPGQEILLGWDFRADALTEAWSAASDLKWIHWCGAGVDAALFEDLRRSSVVLTNARGVFDRPIAEYVLGLVLAMAKGFPRTFAAHSTHRWDYRLTETIEDRPALVVGVGSIGRCIGSMLRKAGMRVSGVGRKARPGDGVFEAIHGIAELDNRLGEADYVINAAPLTKETVNLFCQDQFAAMKPTARFINIGRGASVDEAALIDALNGDDIAGAALDVFRTEPLPDDHPLWQCDNVIISPHMSGDYRGYEQALVELFVDNLRRYKTGRPLRNVVDKMAGFVPSDSANS